MAKLIGSIKVDIQKCKGCDLCVIACPLDVIALSKDANSKGYNFAHMINPDACNGCSACAEVCPEASITVYRVRV
ncbi:MAG TPA: 4Fe-4S binding protein [Paludibacter sp.]|jgi:2-oxoglutarate ferredoxin oxidoreductase subunit delta|nr:MAG: 2-oxoglutarate-acceptor oxidoreductase subunit OorD [Bacteroidetes bacterium ADurb.Bin174]HQB28886.1 4Fe-4S binding protein [Paludibacter sp.]